MFKLRFSLRTLVILLGLVAMSLAYVRQYTAHERLRNVLSRAVHLNPPPAKHSLLSCLFDHSHERIRHASFHGRERVNDADMLQIARLSDLRRLSLYGAAISDKSADSLARHTNLETLSLENCQITDKTMRAIAKLKRLKSLNLNGTLVTDKSIWYLVGLPKLAELKALNARFSGRGVSRLGASKSLETIELSATSPFSLSSSPALKSIRIYVSRLDEPVTIEYMPALEHATIEVHRVVADEPTGILISSAPKLKEVVILGAGADLSAAPSMESLFVIGNGAKFGDLGELPRLKLRSELPKLMKFRAIDVNITPDSFQLLPAALKL
ncbi:MAG: hypothetical protein KDB23_31335 [Planctomycetales bacterium]|nr:hypothetical protein [Planctomycetales bacterium]